MGKYYNISIIDLVKEKKEQDDFYEMVCFVDNWVDQHYNKYSDEYDYDLFDYDYCIEVEELEYERQKTQKD